jgi:hypothetical protein
MSKYDCRSTEDLVCPYCGYVEGDSWELANSDDAHQCGKCEKFFSYDSNTVRYFSSSQVPCLNGEKPHGWVQMPPYPGEELDLRIPLVYRCRVCDARMFRADDGTEIVNEQGK